MIKDFFVRIKGPHLFLSLIFIGLGFIVLALAVKGYKEYSQREIRTTQSQPRHDSNLSQEELWAMFAVSGDPAGNEFEVVARKNLFSPDREAWTPPPPREGEEEASPVRARRINPGEFKLYGVTFAGDEKMALVHYQRLPQNSRNRLVSEGETVYQERNGGEAVYRVVSIGAEAVTLEANGDSFEVGLFSHERQNVQSAGEDRISIAIGGTSRPADTVQASPAQEPEATPAPEPSEATSASEPSEAGPTEARPSAPDSGQDPGAEQGQTPTAGQSPPDTSDHGRPTSGGPDDQPGEGGLSEIFQRLREMAGQTAGSQTPGDTQSSGQQRDMQQIDTPFGSIYRPAN